MDYILFGTGFGASLMLIGWVFRTFGPDWKYTDGANDDPDIAVRKRFWTRFIQGLGGVLAIAGISIVVLTFLVMLSNPDDDTGTIFSLVMLFFVSMIVLGWCITYLSRFGFTGIWSKDEGYGFRKSPVKSVSSRQVSVVSETRDPRPLGPPVIVTPRESAPEETLVEVETEVEDPEIDVDADYDFGDGTDTTVPAAQEDHVSS